MLQRLYNFLLLFKEYVLLSTLIVLSLILLALNDNVQIKHLRALMTIGVGYVQEQLSFIPTYLNLKSENELLRRMNIDLADQANQLREAKLENLRLRRLLEFKETSKYSLIPAKVVGKNLTLMRNTLTVNMGEADDVNQHMPAVSDAGLVGVVEGTSQHYAIIRLLLNTDFRASAKVQRTRVDGIMAWDGTQLTLKNVAKTQDIIVGDVVITSEYSSTYPPGIRIGIVNTVREQAGTLFKRVYVTPAADFTRLEEVFILNYLPSPERLELEQRTTRRPRR